MSETYDSHFNRCESEWVSVYMCPLTDWWPVQDVHQSPHDSLWRSKDEDYDGWWTSRGDWVLPEATFTPQCFPNVQRKHFPFWWQHIENDLRANRGAKQCSTHVKPVGSNNEPAMHMHWCVFVLGNVRKYVIPKVTEKHYNGEQVDWWRARVAFDSNGREQSKKRKKRWRMLTERCANLYILKSMMHMWSFSPKMGCRMEKISQTAQTVWTSNTLGHRLKMLCFDFIQQGSQ